MPDEILPPVQSKTQDEALKPTLDRLVELTGDPNVVPTVPDVFREAAQKVMGQDETRWTGERKSTVDDR